MKKATYVDENMTPLNDIWETYLGENFTDGICQNQLTDMKGLFMTGAASVMRLLTTIKESDMPAPLLAILVSQIVQEAEENSVGRGVKMSVESFTMPASEEVH